MSEVETALWWARVRAAGPQLVPTDAAHPLGMNRLPEPGTTSVWLLPVSVDGAEPSVADELGLPLTSVDYPNDTARVLAACVRCCWPDSNLAMWPGVSVTEEAIASVLGEIINREEGSSKSTLTGALRRLAASDWLLRDETAHTIRLGPRVAAWGPPDLSTLRELWRMLPAPTSAETALPSERGET